MRPFDKKFAGVIFDMDGVIVDSEPRHERAFREIFAEMGLADRHGVHFPDYYGRSDQAVWVDFIERHRPAQSLAELTEWKQRRFIDLIRSEQPIFPTLPELVRALAAHYPLAVASGSRHVVIDEVLALDGLRGYFSAVTSVEDVARPKPAPDVFLRAAELLGVPPAQCCVIEDAPAGVEAARAAGITVIGITNSVGRDRLSRADRIVANYQEIEDLLLPKPSVAP
jgi:HAD superfamily hydrolase (TIGR01509 family)